MDFNDILRNDAEFRYRLLSRMQADCNYYLGYGNRHPKYLWAGSEKDQIECMKALWNSFPEDGKPEWLSFEAILDYEKQMVTPEKPPLAGQIKAAEEKVAATQISSTKGTHSYEL